MSLHKYFLHLFLEIKMTNVCGGILNKNSTTFCIKAYIKDLYFRMANPVTSMVGV